MTAGAIRTPSTPGLPEFVLDVSATAAWLLPEGCTPAAERAYARLRAGLAEAHAPELWLWDCGSLIASAVKCGRVAPQGAQPLWGVLDSVRTRVDLVAFEPAQARACLALAIDAGLSMHDAAYLWLAMSLRLPLLTYDERLAAAAQRQQVPVWRMENLV